MLSLLVHKYLNDTTDSVTTCTNMHQRFLGIQIHFHKVPHIISTSHIFFTWPTLSADQNIFTWMHCPQLCHCTIMWMKKNIWWIVCSFPLVFWRTSDYLGQSSFKGKIGSDRCFAHKIPDVKPPNGWLILTPAKQNICCHTCPVSCLTNIDKYGREKIIQPIFLAE